MIGVLQVMDTRIGRFNQEHLRLLEPLAAWAAAAIENARLYEAERAAREQLRALAGYLQTAREEERTHIAREIHDELGQVLTALKIDLAWVARHLSEDETALTGRIDGMSGLIDAAIGTVRRVATELRPGLLDDLGLVAAVEWQTEDLAHRMGIEHDLNLSGETFPLERDRATAVFRILQETLTNVARHAAASRVRVDLTIDADEVVLIVADNGKGIAQTQITDPSSLGLMGIRERAHAFDGDVTFLGAPGQGTTVTMRMPRTKQGEGG